MSLPVLDFIPKRMFWSFPKAVEVYAMPLVCVVSSFGLVFTKDLFIGALLPMYWGLVDRGIVVLVY